MRNVMILLACVLGSMRASSQATFTYFSYRGDDVRFASDYDTCRQTLNPILAGFYPDPSICRVGDTYYLVNSTFAFFPGVPIFESKDLANWRQIGHVLNRESQLPLGKQGVSGGIYAPDIKYNPRNKTFYMITTNVGKGNFFVKTKDPHQGWSEPVYLPQIEGIDPSFFFDKDGRAFIVHNAPVMGGSDYEGQCAIRILEFDVKGDSIIGMPRQIVRGGTHVEKAPIWIEGPHLYRIGKYYYLMCAEGGTGDRHSEVIFRAPVKSDIMEASSWEECPWNPILTQRDITQSDDGHGLQPADAVSSTGHADLIRTKQGDWYAVFLGCRPYEGDYYHTGRDTYLLPVSWRDGWPVILERGLRMPVLVNHPYGPKLEGTQAMTGNFSYTDYFREPELGFRWVFLRNPSSFYRTGNGLTITPKAVSLMQKESPSAIFCRQQHTCFEAETEVNFTPHSASDVSGMVLFQNEAYHFVFGVTLLHGKKALTLTRTEGTPLLVASASLNHAGSLRLKVVGRGRYYDFFYAETEGDWQVLARGVDAVHLSTARSGGFIGTFIGLYAASAP